MYNFHYNFIIRKFNTRLLFTETDSLCYELREKPPYKKTKDEYGGKSILKFAGLKYKMYSILDESSNQKSTNKGRNAFKEFQEFHDTLFQKKILRHQMRGIKSKNHNLGTCKTNKTSLSCFDDKRYILRNGIETFAYGHKDV